MIWMILNSDGSMLAEKDLRGTVWKSIRNGYVNVDNVDMVARCRGIPPFKLVVYMDDGTSLVDDGVYKSLDFLVSKGDTIRFRPGNLTHLQKPTGNIIEKKVNIIPRIVSIFKRRKRRKK